MFLTIGLKSLCELIEYNSVSKGLNSYPNKLFLINEFAFSLFL